MLSLNQDTLTYTLPHLISNNASQQHIYVKIREMNFLVVSEWIAE